MKENKFRGISKYTGELVYGQLLKGENDYNIVTHFSRAIDMELVPIQSGTQCQYTGLKDIKGRDVYESDILRLKGKKGYEFLGDIGIIRMSYSAYVVETHSGEFLFIYFDEVEVIGNIYENPELLVEHFYQHP